MKISVTTLLKRIIEISENIKSPILAFGKTYELDELRFFLRRKSNLMRLVYAIDKETKRVATFYIGRTNNTTLNAVVKTLLNTKAKNRFTNKLKNYQYFISEFQKKFTSPKDTEQTE